MEARRRNRQIERGLQREVVLRLKHAPLRALMIGSANGIFIPARTPAEREMARRIVYQLKLDGAINPGAADLVFLWGDGCGCIELKRPATRDLLSKARRGELSEEQRAFRMRCFEHLIRHAVCESWADVRDTLIAWGRLPAGWREPEARVGRAA
jgi:hypothetical protein